MLSLGKFLELSLGGREPCEKIQINAQGARLIWRAEGVLEVDPPAADDCGRDLILSAGIHGNETAPIELLDRLLVAIASNQLKVGTRVLFVLGNLDAMRKGERYLSEDLNRLFSGRHEMAEGSEALRADALEKYCTAFYQPEPEEIAERERMHYDLHTAIRGSRVEKFALYPFVENRPVRTSALARLQAGAVETVLLQNRHANTFSAFTAAHLQAESFTIELGKARPFGHNQDVDLTAMEQMLRTLISGAEVDADGYDSEAMQLYTVAREVIKHSESFRLHLADNVENFTELAEGYLLAEDCGERFVVEEPGARIIFPNPKVKNGLRAGLLIVPL
ncbi:succinylglutamate desuccinylase [Atopomonas sediminilitoris]|uniref:succinylglutamate desuccinylase n=1 Tax=Atopomonas sediminilitoris TaxID=2919919 RepID=UPI001F4DDD5D|nr:succinylglutamate desuccinylase [Atopomonas sediminilitoris]MCJ8170055.1 succinylglutamate desuccinylase [Atopomonas sediminilitoris]